MSEDFVAPGAVCERCNAARPADSFPPRDAGDPSPRVCNVCIAADRPGAPTAEPVYQADVCSKCGIVRPLSDFYERGADWGPGASRPTCRVCRSQIPVPTARALVDWKGVPAQFRAVMAEMLDGEPGMSFAEAKRRAGLPANWGTTGFLTNARTREIMKQLLTDAGLDMPFMVQKLALQSHAMKPLWNPAEGRFVFFADNAVQAKALELLNKLWDTISNGKNEGGGGPQIVIFSNIGDGKPTITQTKHSFELDLAPSSDGAFEPVESEGQ